MESLHSKWIDAHADFAARLHRLAENPEISRPEVIRLVDCDRLERELLHRKADAELAGRPLSEPQLKFETARHVLQGFGVSDSQMQHAYRSYCEKTQKFSCQLGIKTSIMPFEQFIGSFYDSSNNTNFITQFNQSFIFLDNKEKNMAVSGQIMFSGLSPQIREALADADIFSISRKRGFYHEATHCTGTDNEKICDSFAVLKILQEHPNPAVVEFLANARLNGMMYPLAVMNHHLQHNNLAQADKWRSYIMTPTLLQISDRSNALIQSGELPHMDDGALLKEASSIAENSEYSPQAMAELDLVLSHPLSFDNLKTTAVIRDTFALAGLTSPHEQKRFLEDGLIYNGAFRVLANGGKNVESEVLNHPEKRIQAQKIMSEWGMNNRQQEEFLERNRKSEHNRNSKKQMLSARQNQFIHTAASSLKKEYPDISPEQLRYQLTHQVVDYNLEQISNIGARFNDNPRLYFDQDEIQKTSAQAGVCRSQAADAAATVNNYLKCHTLSDHAHSPSTCSSLQNHDYSYQPQKRQNSASQPYKEDLSL